MAGRRDPPEGLELDRELADERRAEAADAFRRRIAAGDYEALFDRGVLDTIARAADRPLSDELGALRIVLVRLLTEEQDLTKLANGVARLAGVAVQTARAQKALGTGQSDTLSQAMSRMLADLDAEEEARRDALDEARIAADTEEWRRTRW